MKFIKKYESFHGTGVDDGSGEQIPGYNPVINQRVREFVDSLCGKGRQDELAKIIGEKVPSDLGSDSMDEYEDKLKERVIKYLIDNPEALPSEVGINTYKVPAGDGITRTNKVGGTSQTGSFRIGQ